MYKGPAWCCAIAVSLALAGCWDATDESRWSVSALGKPAIERQVDGSTNIAGGEGFSGARFKRADLDRGKVYRLEISGAPRSGRAVVGIKRADLPFAYANAPDGKIELIVSAASRVEILVHGDAPFAYRARLAISQCPGCLTDDRLREIVRAGLPGIDGALGADRLAAVERLLHWAASVVELGGDIPEFANLQNAFPLMSAAQIYSDVWLKHAGGTSCAGFAEFLQKLLGVFGVRALTIDVGYAGTILTHVTTVVPVESGGKTKFYIFDPTFGGTYRARQDGGYADVESMLDGSVAAVFAAKQIPRTVIYPNKDADRMRRAFATLHLSPNCGVVASESYTRCEAVPYDVNYLLAGWSQPLRERSIPPDADLILSLMRKQILSVSNDAGPAVRNEFLAMIERTQMRAH